MKILLSPAKSLNVSEKSPTHRHTFPFFTKEIRQLQQTLKTYSPRQLKQMMGISESLAELNWKRYQDFSFPFSTENAKQAVFTFDGDVYAGLDAYSLPEENWDTLERSVRILSGLYGVLKPFDLIQPYRLEMGTHFSFDEFANLYMFWRPKIARYLNSELSDKEAIVNLASQEYFKSVNVGELKTQVISPVFKDRKGDDYKVVSFYAKKARGLMARYLVQENIQSVEDIKGFDYQGYKYSDNATKKASEPVFLRG